MPRPGMTRVRRCPFLYVPVTVMPSVSIRTVSSDTLTMPWFAASYCSALTIRGASSMPESGGEFPLEVRVPYDPMTSQTGHLAGP